MTATDRVTQLKKIAEGREAEIFAYGEGRVLRLFRGDRTLEHTQTQAAILQAAADAGVRVPAVYGVETVDGRHGMILERLDGEDLFEIAARKPWRILSLASLTGRLQADLHGRAAPMSLVPVRERYRQAVSGSGAPQEFIGAALKTLDRLPDGDRLLHGDFHPGNIMLGDQGPVIIDWTGATRGSPEADFARSMLILRLGEPPSSLPLLIRFFALFARSLFMSTINRTYHRNIAVDEKLLRNWQLPTAVARIGDGIAEEREKLDEHIRELIASDTA
ncbi:MAG: phosphotransferase [Chloroflexi bacterium]|nr:phosphotransferase [Chloroflexota bacterium]